MTTYQAVPHRNWFTFRRSDAIRWLISLGLLVIGFFYLYPFIWMAGSSLKTEREFFSRGINFLPGGDFQWENYILAWEKAQFGRYFANTAFNAIATVLLTVLLTSLSAYALSRLKTPFRNTILLLVGITLLLPRGYTVLPVLDLMKSLGLLNTRWAVIVSYVSGNMIFYTFLFYGFMRTIPREIEEAAIIDGATVLQRYWRVILPLSTPMISTVALFSYLGAWNEFFTALVMTLGKPELRTLSVGMYAFVSQTKNDWTLMCAAGIISITPVVVLFSVLSRQFVDAFSSAVKS